jgi:hypothetical protein
MDYFKFSVDDGEIESLTIPEGGFWENVTLTLMKRLVWIINKMQNLVFNH